MTGPLHGVRVVDFSRVLTGPWATMTLGDLGADVIKVEPPGGDDTRLWGPPFKGEMSGYFACVNRNKRSIVLNLKDKKERELAHQLVAQADVVVENFRGAVAEKLGIGATELMALNPRLIYCSISGYGRTGPRKDFGGYDAIIQGQAGIMSITGPEHGPPFKLGASIVDITAGMNAVQAILAALYAREKTGKGERIDIALYGTQLQWLANVASNVLFSGEGAKRYGNYHPNIVPYGVFNAADGPFVVAVGNEKHWQRLCTAIDRADWLDDKRFTTNADRVAHRNELIKLLNTHFATASRDIWLPKISESGVPCGKVHSVKEALDHDVTRERGLLHTMTLSDGTEIPMLGSPLHLTNHPVELRLPPPLLDEHRDEILTELKG